MSLSTYGRSSTWLLFLGAFHTEWSRHGVLVSLLALFGRLFCIQCVLALAPDLTALLISFTALPLFFRDCTLSRVYAAMPISRQRFGRMIWTQVMVGVIAPFLLLMLWTHFMPGFPWFGDDYRFGAPSALLLLAIAAAGLAFRFFLPPIRRSAMGRGMDILFLALLLGVPVTGILERTIAPLGVKWAELQFLLLAASVSFSLAHMLRTFLAAEKITDRLRSRGHGVETDSECQPHPRKLPRTDPTGMLPRFASPSGIASFLVRSVLTAACVYLMVRHVTTRDYPEVALNILVLVLNARHAAGLARNIRTLRSLPLSPDGIILRFLARTTLRTLAALGVTMAILAALGELHWAPECLAILLAIPGTCAMAATLTLLESLPVLWLALALLTAVVVFGQPVLACAFPLWTIAGTLLVTPVLWWVLYLFITRSSRAYQPGEMLKDVL